MSEVKYICSRQICFTCLSGNRKNFQLMKIEDGVNFLYNLLSRDCEAYRVSNWYVSYFNIIAN